MRNFRKYLPAIAIISLIIFLFISLAPYISSIVHAKTSAELQQELKAAEANKTKAQQNLKKAEQQQKVVKADKEYLDSQIAKIEDEIYEFSTAIAKNEEEIAAKESEIEEAEAQIQQYDAEFRDRARAMYKRGDTSYLEVLFGSKDFADLMYRIEMLKRITDYDKSVLKIMADAKQVIVDAKAEVEEQKAQHELNKEILETKQGELSIKQSEKKRQLEILDADVAEARRIADAEDAAMAELKRQLGSMISGGTASSGSAVISNGTLLWPSATTKYITSYYGTRFHPIQQRYKTHTGIDIGAASGTDVLAAESGKVIMSTWNGGYGKCVVIDHGNGLSTLYGHNSVLCVSVGQQVSRGDVIAKVGSTGNSTGPHIHFEVLINGAHQNPMSYVG